MTSRNPDIGLLEELGNKGLVLGSTISTSHISRFAKEWLERYCATSQAGALTVANYGEGWWISVPPLDDADFLEWADEHRMPASLLLALRRERDRGVAWVQLDRDGDRWDQLAVFDW